MGVVPGGYMSEFIYIVGSKLWSHVCMGSHVAFRHGGDTISRKSSYPSDHKGKNLDIPSIHYFTLALITISCIPRTSSVESISRGAFQFFFAFMRYISLRSPSREKYLDTLFLQLFQRDVR